MSNTWQKLNETIVFKGFRGVINRKYELPNGSQKDFQIYTEGPSVHILAITSENKVILVKQFRPGPEKILIELPAGYIDKNESPRQAAKRELREETGYRGNVTYIGASLYFPYGNFVKHNFVATDCVRNSNQHTDADEFIDLIEMPLKDFRKHLQTGQLCNVDSAYLGLDFLGLLK